MQAGGIREDQVTQVRGYADQMLRKGGPMDPSNRRISVIVQYLERDNREAPIKDGKVVETANAQEPSKQHEVTESH